MSYNPHKRIDRLCLLTSWRHLWRHSVLASEAALDHPPDAQIVIHTNRLDDATAEIISVVTSKPVTETQGQGT